jgi:hypothetical protein
MATNTGTDIGSTTQTTLGTITTGVWNGTTIAVSYGGTGITVFGTGVAAALGANVSGSGGIALATSPTLGTPNIVGVTNASSATAGSVGEFITSNVPFGSAVSLTTATATTVTSISLTAGDWNVYGNVSVNASGANLTGVFVWANTSATTLPDGSLFNDFIGAAASGFNTNIPNLRVNVSGATTVYLSVEALFVTGTATACGSIFARRVR